MAGTNLSLPFDAEVFNYSWKNTPDLILTSMLESGALVNDGEIANLISNGSNFFVTPFYDLLSGTEDVYNGVNTFTDGTITGGTYAGVVYGRMRKWSAISFIKDFNSGGDPMAQIVDGVAKYYIKKRQERLVNVIEAVLGITGDATMDTHSVNLTTAGVAQVVKAISTGVPSANGSATLTLTASGLAGSPLATVVPLVSGDTAIVVAGKVRTALLAVTAITNMFTVTGTGADVILTKKVNEVKDTTLAIVVAAGTATGTAFSASTDETVYVVVLDTNKIGATTIADTCVKAVGDNAGAFSLVIAHSVVANKLANLQLLEFSKYTDSAGITRELPIGTINGKTLVVNDNVKVTNSTKITGEKNYSTYILGQGAIRFAQASVDVPSEMFRDPNAAGGTDMIYTRIRECMAPYGFSFKGDVATDVGIPDSVLTASASWERKMPAKSVLMAKVVTNG